MGDTKLGILKVFRSKENFDIFWNRVTSSQVKIGPILNNQTFLLNDFLF